MLRYLNLALLVAYPVAWFAPLMRAGLLPLFGLSEISVMTGLQSLWASDVFLALMVTVFALFAPYLKTIGLALLHWNLLSARCLPALHLLGKFAMADIFLIALYITLTKGIGVGRIEVAWGLYLFTACILASLWIGWRTEQRRQPAEIVSEMETPAAKMPQHNNPEIR
ncbi:paraquat-inducible protein A [Pseudosulfitobacter sp. DSM 107133]|uniref:paraquat-inducible protein A n=1 Tax=Pseudosulfitobacter sp. DSM 107133 TaxID=2883100 RepID=UPI000DF40C6F|nr:paraquat-inducible protein A [Pseudosulfitobacter sp. DSM 107133]UOA27585.1 hypothetical protein DSM107133_02315 [Pseudosulfitobacter sp. DSM 107133]